MLSNFGVSLREIFYMRIGSYISLFVILMVEYLSYIHVLYIKIKHHSQTSFRISKMEASKSSTIIEIKFHVVMTSEIIKKC